MLDESKIKDIISKIKATCDDSRPCTLSEDEGRLVVEALERQTQMPKGHSFTCYELNDRDGCPVMYLNIADCYPKEFVMEQINELIKDDAETRTIKYRLAETCGAVEITPEHVILPHIE